MTSSKAPAYHHLMKFCFKGGLGTADAVLCTETSVQCVHNQRCILRFIDINNLLF